MKSHEFINEHNTPVNMVDDTERLARLKSEIEAGWAPIVHNVSGTKEPVFTMGDVQTLGWMTKEYETDYDGEVTGWKRYYHKEAPGPIRVKTQGESELEIWQPGHKEEN